MGASLGMGKNLRFVEPGDDGGARGLAGTPLHWENMAYSSIAAVKAIAAEQLAIPAALWPFYEVQFEEELPLADIRAQCFVLRCLLAPYAIDQLPDDYWIRALARALREGYDFCSTST